MNHKDIDRDTVPRGGHTADTIVALASGPGVAAIAVIRISGPATRSVLEALTGALPEPRRATLRRIGAPPIDRGLVLWFPAPASFTGEDMAEIQVHGGRAVVQAVVGAALAQSGTRLAEPGEFTRRAFENGRLDLTEVEGLADLVQAETEAQARQALAQAEGALRRLYEDWRAELLNAQSLMEAGLDFSDEADVALGASRKASSTVEQLLRSLEMHLADRSGERLREGLRVVIAGPPNVGKSSLLNALAKRDAAIVSEEAGTTRDVIEVHLDLAGLPVILADTAGIRDAAGALETEGIRRALARVEDADLVLWVIDATNPVFDPPRSFQGTRVVRTVNKADLRPKVACEYQTTPDVVLSAKTGQGLDDLVAGLEAAAKSQIGESLSAPLTRARHRQELVQVRDALKRFVNHDLAPELSAEELRIAAHHLGRLTGRIDVEEVLGAIFSAFCIGK